MPKSTGLIPVETPTIGGVTLPRSPLDRAVRDLAKIARMLSRRILDWDHAAAPDAELPLAVAHAAGAVDRIVRGLLAEQRARAQMTSGRPPLSDEEYAEELRHIEDRGVRTMPRERLEQLLAERNPT